MLDHWFKPIKPIVPENGWDTFEIGNHISFFNKKNPNIEKGGIVLIGTGKAADQVRKSLFHLSVPSSHFKVIDLGNFRKNSVEFMIPAIEELLNSDLLPIIISGEAPFAALASIKAINRQYKNVSLTLVEPQITLPIEDISSAENYLEDIFKDSSHFPYHLAAIGLQAHFTNPEVFKFFEKNAFEFIRLGKSKSNLGELEPIIRDGDLMILNMESLQANFAPEQNKPSPSGFNLEEACTIARYAGMSDKLKIFNLFGVQNKLSVQGLTAQSVAQIIWYFIEGYYHRKQDFPASMDGLTEYIVDLKNLDYQITFWRSSKSGRWWMQVPFANKQSMKRHALISCSYNDYKKASNDELPDRLLQALKRFS